jgi:uncharacterized protein (DUF2141 family)
MNKTLAIMSHFRRIALFGFAAVALLNPRVAGVGPLSGIFGTIVLRTGETGVLHISLVDEDGFGSPDEAVEVLVFRMTGNRTQDFRFEDIPPGVYGIRAYLDVDGDGRLDSGIAGPTEPWGMSWNSGKPRGWPRFTDISFELADTVQRVRVVLE